MSDRLNLKKFIRDVDDFPIPGIKFRDITGLIETPKAFRKTCKELIRITQQFSPDLIVSIESRGFVFAGPVATELLLPFILARKPGKLPNET
jgi:adenine phosphoribosyltransferase